jgi:hypothetical protein
MVVLTCNHRLDPEKKLAFDCVMVGPDYLTNKG